MFERAGLWSADSCTVQLKHMLLTNTFLNLFLPSTVRYWNNLFPEIVQSDSVASFKYTLNRDRTHIPKYFYSGNRHAQVFHACLRTQCSALHHDLFKKNIPDTPSVAVELMRILILSFSNALSTILYDIILYMKCQM